MTLGAHGHFGNPTSARTLIGLPENIPIARLAMLAAHPPEVPDG